LAKLNVRDRTDAAISAVRRGIVHLEKSGEFTPNGGGGGATVLLTSADFS